MEYKKENVDETIDKLKERINRLKEEEKTNENTEEINYLKQMQNKLETITKDISSSKEFNDVVSTLEKQATNLCVIANKMIVENKWDEKTKKMVNEFISDEQLDKLKIGINENIKKADKIIGNFVESENTKKAISNIESTINKGIGKGLKFVDKIINDNDK